MPLHENGLPQKNTKNAKRPEKHANWHGPEGCDENGPAAVPQLPDPAVAGRSLPALGPAAHFDRNESHAIYGTGH
jgi:hypothetical protein